MATLSRNDYRSVLSAIETISHLNSIEQFPSVALSAVSKAISCNAICFNEINLTRLGMSWITEPANAMPSSFLQEVFKRHINEHPMITRVDLADTGRSIKISDLLSKYQFHRLALYNEYYRPLNVEYQLGTTISINRNKILAVALDRDRPDFSENERLRLDFLHLHLKHVYQNLQKLSLIQRSLEESQKNVAIISRSSQMPAASDDFWHKIALYCNISRSPFFLPDVISRWLANERSRFKDDFDISSVSTPLVLTKEYGTLVLRFMWGGKTADWDLILIEEQQKDIIHADAKLTRREKDIMRRLSQGETNAEIGLALAISPRTVKKHLEHIYDKLKVHRRSAAVAINTMFDR